MDDNKKKGNPLWVAGVSGNPSGKPKGAKRNPLTSLQRWYSRNGSLKELDRLYKALQTDKDKIDMMKAVWYYLLPRPQADAISNEEAELLLSKQIQLEQRNKQLEQELKRVKSVEQKAI